MGGLNPFSKPSMPKVETVKQKTAEEKAAEISAAQDEEKRRRTLQAGRGSTMLSSGTSGDDNGIATKRLLGG